MDIADALAVVREQHHAVLATSRGDGTPQMSPVAVAVDQTDHLLVSSRITAYKTRNLQRDPHAWLCVLPDKFFGRWIQTGTTTGESWRPSDASCCASDRRVPDPTAPADSGRGGVAPRAPACDAADEGRMGTWPPPS